MSDFIVPDKRNYIEEELDVGGSDIADYLRQADIFNDALRECNHAIKILLDRFNNRVLIHNLKHDTSKELVNPLHLIEEGLGIDLKFSLEDSGKNIFVRVWEAIKNFFKKIHRWLFGFKAVTKRFFSSMDKDLKHYVEILTRMGREIRGNIEDNFDMEKLDKTKIAFQHHQIVEDYSLNGMKSSLCSLFIKVTDYIRDPERNQEAHLLELEKDDGDCSFKTLLGVVLVTNEREKLGPGRVETMPLGSLYHETKETLSELGIELNNLTFPHLSQILVDYQGIASAALKLDETFLSIQNSYDVLDKELAAIAKDHTADFQTSSKRTRVLVMAKDHIQKSKALIEAFVAVYHTEVKNVLNIVDTLKSAYKK